MIYTGENFKQMRQKLRKPIEENSVKKIESKKENKSVSKSKSPERKISYEKKRIAASMKSIFGEEKSNEYKKFIDENNLLR